MDREAQILRNARKSVDLSMSEMAELIDLDETHVAALEQGTVEASTELLDRYARIFGLSLRRFLAGEAERAPATVLFRSLHTEGPSFQDLVATGATSILGEFLRCAADVAELQATLGGCRNEIAREIGALPAEAAQDVPGLYRQAERLALMVRERLGLGLDPIASMIELVRDRLGVTLFWIGPDELDRDIDAASARAPAPAILINLIGGAECWWRTRMTLAHELCHLLFDIESSAAPSRRAFLFSPHRDEVTEGARPRGLRLPAELERIERRANVFAAHFLAPPEAVRATVGASSPTSDDAIDAVCRRFQIGRITAVNQITNTYRCSKEERRAMLGRRPSVVLPKQHPDAAARPGLRTGLLRDLVERALSEGRIGKTRARQYLAVSLSEPLPLGVEAAEGREAPLHTPEHRARLSANRFLVGRADLAGCYPARVAREGDRFRVEVEHVDEKTWGAPRPAGYLLLSASYEVLEHESRLSTNIVTDA